MRASRQEQVSNDEEDDVVVRNGFMVFVKDLTGATHSVIIGAANTVLDMKILTRNKTGISVDKQRLIFAGMQLEDGRTMSDYNIPRESTIHLVLRMCGC